MNKMDRAWSIFEDARHNQLGSGRINYGFAVGRTLPGMREISLREPWGLLAEGRPDTSLSAEQYGEQLNRFVTSGPAEMLELEKVLLPTGEFAERLKGMKATYREFLGLAIVMNDWADELTDELMEMGFQGEQYTDEELDMLYNRSVGLQGDLYLSLLEEKRGHPRI